MSSGLIFQHGCVIVDACCIINLCATDCMGDILRAAPVRFAVCSYVKDTESLAVYDGADTDGNPKRTPIELQPLVNAGLLEIVVPDWSILSPHIIMLANGGIRGMGEKISGAIAHDKNWAIATDDRDAQRKLAALMPRTQVVTTLELVRNWADVENITIGVLREVLSRIQVRGNYIFPSSHQLYGWAFGVLSDN
ncbi:MAG: hypothetical protein GC179_18565 [Anaerolineaceae bacterium]|nr:hypothetical protein [Anaerolineaceae bacterium]